MRWRSYYNDQAMEWMSKASVFDLCKDRDFIISTASRVNLCNTQPTLQWTLVSFIPRDKVAGAQTWSLTFIWYICYTSSQPCVFMSPLLIQHRDISCLYMKYQKCVSSAVVCWTLYVSHLCLYICKCVKCYCIVEARVFWTASVVYPETEAFVAVKCDSCWKMSDGRWIPYFTV